MISSSKWADTLFALIKDMNNPLEVTNMQCDHCEQFFREAHTREVNCHRSAGKVNNYLLCFHCLDLLSDGLEDNERIECNDCSKEILRSDDKCDCRVL